MRVPGIGCGEGHSAVDITHASRLHVEPAIALRGPRGDTSRVGKSRARKSTESRAAVISDKKASGPKFAIAKAVYMSEN